MNSTPIATLYIVKRKPLSPKLSVGPNRVVWQVELETDAPVKRGLTWDERTRVLNDIAKIEDVKELRNFLMSAIETAEPLEESIEEDEDEDIFQVALIRDALRNGKPIFLAWPKYNPGNISNERKARDAVQFHEVLGLNEGGIFSTTAYGTVSKEDIGKRYVILKVCSIPSTYSKHPKSKYRLSKADTPPTTSDIVLINDGDARNFTLTKAKIFKDLPSMLVVVLEKRARFSADDTMGLIKQYEPV
jgi:hypothetical protein